MRFNKNTGENDTEGQTDAAEKKLVFRIVDSPMGIGKSSAHKVFDAIKNLSRSCDLYPYGDKQGKFTSIIAFMKRELFTCFDQCWFFSYLTKESMLARYCAMNNDIAMEYYHVEKGFIKRNPAGKYQENYPRGIEHLVILEDKRFNPAESLSKEWYKAARNGKNEEGLKKLQRCFRSAYAFMKQKGVRSNTFLFTTFTAYQNLLEGDGRHYPTLKRFLPCNAKATNDYSDCTGVPTCGWQIRTSRSMCGCLTSGCANCYGIFR